MGAAVSSAVSGSLMSVSTARSKRRAVSTLDARPVTPEHQPPCLDVLPPEVWILILSWLPPHEFSRYRNVCKSFDEFIASRHFAILNLERHIGLEHPTVESNTAPDAFDKLLSSWPLTYQSIYLGIKNAKRLREIKWKHARFQNPSIPLSLGELTNLETLELSFSNLSGEIPKALGRLHNLQELSLNYNTLTGDIPALPPSLKVLRLNSNDLSGRIPDHICSLNLERLNLMHNLFQGSIPSSISNSVNLTILSLNGNFLAGSIPSEIGSLVNLRELYLNNNNLNGALPATIGNLIRLHKLDISRNELWGSLPSELGNLRQLQQLDLQHNSFSGTLPSALGRLENLVDLHASNNRFTGAIPAELGNTALEHLYLYDNQLSGCLPSSFGSLAGLRVLDVSRNRLSGYIPSEYSSLMRLKEIHVGGNLGVVISPSVHHESAEYAKLVASLVSK